MKQKKKEIEFHCLNVGDAVVKTDGTILIVSHIGNTVLYGGVTVHQEKNDLKTM